MNIELSLAWRNVWRRSKRTWITVSAIVFCNAILVFGIAVQAGSYRSMIDSTVRLFSGHLQISAIGYHDDPEIRNTVKNGATLAQDIRTQFPDLNVVARSQTFVLAATEERSAGMSIIGIQPELERTFSTLGEAIPESSLSTANTVVVGQSLNRHLQLNSESELSFVGSTLSGGFAANFLTPDGVISTGVSELDQTIAFISLDDFNQNFEMNNEVHQILIVTPDIDEVANVQKSLIRWLDNSDLEVLTWQQLNPGLQESVYADMASAAIMYGVLIALVIFSVLNTQLMSVLERTKEFGIIKAVGLSDFRLSKLIYLETILLASIGFVFGILLGAVITLIFINYGIRIPGMDQLDTGIMIPEVIYPSLTLTTLLLGPSIVFAGSLLAAIYPARKLKHLEPIAAMRAA